MSKYGYLGWAVSPHSGLPYWGLQVRPHVAIKAKRLFPRIVEERTDMISVLDTPEFSADLTWFMQRYPLDMAPDVARRLAERTAEHEAYVADVEAILAGAQVLDDFPEPVRKPRDYQRLASDLAYHTGGLLLGDEVGLGKTQSAVGVLRDPSTLPALIVVPPHLAIQWRREIREIMPRLTPHIITQGSPIVTRKRKSGTVEVPYDTGRADVLIISYSKLSGWRETLGGKIKTVIFDEVQELRHASTPSKPSKKYNAAAYIADRADRRMGLSATPIYNYGGEAFNIYEVLKPGTLGTSSEFYREWGSSMRSTGQIVVDDPRGLGSFLTEQGLLLRRTRAEVERQLPHGAPTAPVITVESGTDEINSVMTDLVSMAEKVLSGTRQEAFVSAGQMDMRMRQATGIDKARQVADVVKMLLESEQKVVLFGWHRAVYDIWLDRLAEFKPTMYTGTESVSAKNESVRAFMEDPERRVFICSLRSGAGLDGLQEVASVCVFGELDWSPAQHHQAIGRLARDGQTSPVVAYYVVSEVGSDPIIQGVLEVKAQQAEQLMAPDDRLYTAQRDVDEKHGKMLARAILAAAGRAVDGA